MPPIRLLPTRRSQPEAQTIAGLLLSRDNLSGAFEVSLDLLFPPRCAGCEKVDTYWCASCQHEMDQIPFSPAQRLASPSPLIEIAATGPHEGKLQRAIWALKFENGVQLAMPLGERLDSRLKALDWKIDMIVPVPLHIHRLRERGYNQAKLIAGYVAQMHDIPLVPQAIQRQVETRSQVGLDAEGRKTNMQGAFQADPHAVSARTILLIDDVYTTGATMAACAQAAREAGATAVYGLTVTTA